MDCERLPACIFFNDQMESMPAVAELLKSQYCRGAFQDCARFVVAGKLGGARVPRDLYPNHTVRASNILAQEA
jgi:methyl-accepting chemotaxis protein